MSGKQRVNNSESIRHNITDHDYFFGTEHEESTILGEFGWSISPDSGRYDARYKDFHQIESATEFKVEDKELPSPMMNPSVDPPEKSTASGSSSADPQPDTASISSTKKGGKQIKQPRFAFITKSEVDHLEDGYRWRKYGQKAVKNSPYPRSYYRCTNTKCIVKKRIERSSEDPTIVITTYEGQHCHISGGYPRFGLRPVTPYIQPRTTVIESPLLGEGLLEDIVSPSTRNGFG